MPPITPDLFERARGCLLGLAVGDAFATPLEGEPRQSSNVQTREMRAGRQAAGRFGAPTEMALTLGVSVLMQPPLDQQALAARLSPPPSVAAQARGLLSRLARSEPKAPATVAELIEEGPRAAAAAPLTRALPVALRYIGDRNQCLQEARSQCQLTHKHPECVAGSAFLAGMLWHLLHGMPPREAMLSSIAACGDLPAPLEQCIRQASTHVRGTLDNNPWVQSAIENALWGMLTSCSYAETVTRVANLGGHAALSTALAGGLAGAAYRISGIPADWRRMVHGPGPVHGAPLWRDREINELAERLVEAWGR